MNKIKVYLPILIVAIALVFRVDKLRNVVTGQA